MSLNVHCQAKVRMNFLVNRIRSSQRSTTLGVFLELFSFDDLNKPPISASSVQINDLLAEDGGVLLMRQQGHDGLDLGARKDVAEVGELLGPVPGLQARVEAGSGAHWPEVTTGGHWGGGGAGAGGCGGCAPYRGPEQRRHPSVKLVAECPGLRCGGGEGLVDRSAAV